MTNRAYSVLTVKAVDEGQRTIRGVATTPASDRMGDVIDPLGVKFTNPMPFLWQHEHDKPIGTVRFEKPTATGVAFEAKLPTIAEPGVLRDRIEEAWQSIRAGLVPAVSIGFRPIEYAFMADGGIHFQEIEVFELSAVTIPANAEAVITSAKQLDTAAVAVLKKFDLGAPAASGRPTPPAKPPGVTGKSHKPVSLTPKEGKDMNIAEQIAALEAKRAANAARMTEVMQKSLDAGRTTEAAEQEEFDTLESEMTTIDGDLKRLKSLQAIAVASARPVDPAIRTQEQGAAARSGVSVKAQTKLAPGIEFARAVKCFGMAKGIRGEAISIAKQLYGENANVVGTLNCARGDGLGIEKAEVSAGANIAGNWAVDLVGSETSAYADFVNYLRPQTIIGKFGANGVPSLRAVPFRVPLVTQTGPGEGYWVGEGKPKPLTNFGFTRTTLQPLKVANIAVLTKEMIRDSSPNAEMVVRDELANALRQRLDIDFVDPSKAASAGVSPASITYGAESIVSTGDDAADVRLDVRALMQKFIDANNPPSTGVWIMSTSNALALSMLVNALGQPEFNGIGMNGGVFFGLPVIASEYIGNVVALVNAGDIYFADEGGISIDMSTEASLEMLDSGLQGSSVTDVNATSLVSMFQTNSVAFLAERALNWARRRTSAVAYLTSVDWGGAVPAS